MLGPVEPLLNAGVGLAGMRPVGPISPEQAGSRRGKEYAYETVRARRLFESGWAARILR